MTKEKKRHQVKSQWYYIFWGTATVAVCAGQVFVGSGFRRKAESFEKVLDAPIQLDFGIPRRRHPMIAPPHKFEWEDGDLYFPTDPPMKVSPKYREEFERSI